MRTIAVVNQKGGCGKTITAINLSSFLARAGRRVLLVDMDPQGHATVGMLSDSEPPPRTMYDVLQREAGVEQTRLFDILRTVRDNLDLAPADILLSAIPDVLAGVADRERALSDALAEIRGRYDYVIVDCPPHVGLLTFNALYACSEAIVPMDPSFFSLHGIGKLLETFEVVARHSGHQIVPRILVTLYPGRSPFVKAVVEEMRTHLAGRYFNTVIRYSVKLAEAASHGVPIDQYAHYCAGFEDYQALAAEVVQQEADMPASIEVAVETVATPATIEAPPVVPSAPAVTPDGVMFTLEAPEAARVQLVGDFNQWALDGNEMKPAGRIWTKIVQLAPGRYRYRYVVDGRWQSDPLNGAIEPCPFGGHDSVLVLEGGPRDLSSPH